MSGDASDDLRQRMNELEATVRGLTQELVEANERIRQLEERVEAGPSADRPMPSASESPDEPPADEPTDGDESEGSDDDVDDLEDDIIVA